MNQKVIKSELVFTVDRIEKAVTPVTNRAEHFSYIDGFRAVAALFVLIHHCFLQVDTGNFESALLTGLFEIFREGRYAVDLFIVISGYCLMLPVLKNGDRLKGGAIYFFKKRAFRILPAYYFAMLFSLVLIYTIIGEKTGTNWDISIPVNQMDIITHVLLIQDLFPETIYKINHVFWSISVEVHIYLLFPLLVWMWRKFGTMLFGIGTLGLSMVLWLIFDFAGLNVFGMAPQYVSLFAFGMLAASFQFKKTKPWLLLPGLLFALLICYFHPIVRDDLFAGAISATVIYFIAFFPRLKISKWISWTPLAFTGGFAYSIYLIHAPILQIISAYILIPSRINPDQSVVFFLTMGIPLVLAASYVFYLTVEKKFLSYRARTY